MASSLLNRAPEWTGSSDFRIVKWGLVLTAIIHGILAFVLATAGSGEQHSPAGRLCGEIRCPADPFLFKRRGPVAIDADVGIIEASVIPRLGMAEQKGLPRFQKYERPERIENAVNVSKEPPPDKADAPLMAPKKEKEQIDRRRQEKPRTLSDVLGAPDDDDPRARATRLEKIVGSRDGSIYGSGSSAVKGNIYAGKVAAALRQHFTVPPAIPPDQLRHLRVRVRVSRIDTAGQIVDYQVIETSSDKRFNAAAMQAIRQFSVKDGGNAHLPSPDTETLDLIAAKGIVIDLDGALFKK